MDNIGIYIEKIRRPSWVYCATKTVAFTLDSRNKQVILDSYQSEIFCYTTNPGY